MNLKIVIATMLVAASANATENHNNGNNGNDQAQGQVQLQGQLQGQTQSTKVGIDVDSTNIAAAAAKSNSASLSTSLSISEGGSGGAGGAAASDSNANSSSGGNSLTVNESGNSSHVAASTPAAVVGNTTATCRYFIGVSGMGTNGGGGLGYPVKDKDCELMEMSSFVFAHNNPTLGWDLFCRTSVIKKLITYEGCMATSGTATAASAAEALKSQASTIIIPMPTYTKSEVDERVNRAALAAVAK